jgi:hypothetical protein
LLLRIGMNVFSTKLMIMLINILGEWVINGILVGGILWKFFYI